MNNIRTKGKERYKDLLLKLIDKYLEHIKNNNSLNPESKYLPTNFSKNKLMHIHRRFLQRNDNK